MIFQDGNERDELELHTSMSVLQGSGTSVADVWASWWYSKIMSFLTEFVLILISRFASLFVTHRSLIQFDDLKSKY